MIRPNTKIALNRINPNNKDPFLHPSRLCNSFLLHLTYGLYIRQKGTDKKERNVNRRCFNIDSKGRNSRVGKTGGTIETS